MDNEPWDADIRVLIIDDDLHVLAVLEDLFSEEARLRVKGMSSSLEALALMRKETFDLVITDLRMDEADGLEVARVARVTQKDALVIMVTGYASLETTLEAIHLGVYDYITKPFQVDEFRLRVNNAATRIRLQREAAWLRSRVVEIGGEMERLRLERDDLRQEIVAKRLTTRRQEELENGPGRRSAPRQDDPDTARIGALERVAAARGRLRSPSEGPAAPDDGSSGSAPPEDASP